MKFNQVFLEKALFKPQAKNIWCKATFLSSIDSSTYCVQVTWIHVLINITMQYFQEGHTSKSNELTLTFNCNNILTQLNSVCYCATYVGKIDNSLAYTMPKKIYHWKWCVAYICKTPLELIVLLHWRLFAVSKWTYV